jgi:hypothetical protein
MQVGHQNTETRSVEPVSSTRLTAPTPMTAIEAAAEFECRLDEAQAAAEAPPADRVSDDAQSSGNGRSNDGGDDDSEQAFDARFSPPAWAASSFGAGMPTPDAAASVPTGAPASQAWAEISAHIERMLITDPAGRPDGAAALFRLAPELLRETTVALSRNAHGWLLRVDSGDPRLRVDSTRHEAALRERFARTGLGDLVIEQGDLPDFVSAVGA